MSPTRVSADPARLLSSQRPLRVLHVINGLGRGGAETVLYRLAIHSSRVQHEVICLEGREWYSERLEEAGIKVHHLQWTSVASVAPLNLYGLIKESGADLVQAWMYRSNLVAGICSRVAGKLVVWNIRCSSLKPLRKASRILAYAGGFLARWLADFVINCSAQSRQLHGTWGYDEVEGAVIPNGYDPAMFCPDDRARAITRDQLGVAPDQFLIGTVGRWHAQKGYPVLLKAAELLVRRGIPFRLLFIGRALDSVNAELSELVRASGCAEFVQLIGERSDIPELDRALDLHVLASVGTEGFPNVVAETMLSGTPNVVTDVGDAALIVGETGWIVAAGDAVQLAEAMEAGYRQWKSSRAQWQLRCEAVRDRIANNFSLDRMIAAYEEVWRRVAAKPCRRHGRHA